MKKHLIALFIALFVLANSVFAGPPYPSTPYPWNPPSIGAAVIGRAVTATLHVSPNGNGTNGETWATAYTTIQAALDSASTDGDDCTLILISPHTTNYDIYTTGDPTWTGNYIIKGSHRNWAKIKNTHATADSILKFTGKTSLIDLNFNLHTANDNGVIFTHGGWRIRNCAFVGEDLTGAATAIWIDGASPIKHGIIENVHIDGHVTHMTGLLLDNASHNHIEHTHMHECLVGLKIVNAASDENVFEHVDIGDCALGFDLDAGNEMHFNCVCFHGNIRNVDDEVGDHIWSDIRGHFPLTLLPDNFTGVDLDTGSGTAWGSDTEIIAANAIDDPFRVVGVSVEADANEKFRVRLSNDGGATHFVDVQLQGQNAVPARVPISLPSGTEEIFNTDDKISGSAKSESGSNTATIWLQIQEI